jgi:polar amino acid transport system substrate-binding protein
MRTVIVAALVGLLAAVIGVKVMGPAGAESAAAESVYERVKRTGVIRCGYYIWPPIFTQDPNTGKMGGIWYELTERVAKELSLKVEWTTKIDFPHIFEDLKMQRYDMVCGPFVPTPSRAREGDFSQPVFWGMYKVFVRAKDFRFDNAWEKLNDPAVKLAVAEGDLGQAIAREDFPKAQHEALTNLADPAQVLQEVVSGKADATFIDPITALTFDRNNPGKVVMVPGGAIRTFPLAFVVATGEHEFRRMLDHTIQTLQDTGYVERLSRDYPDFKHSFILPKTPYEEVK